NLLRSVGESLHHGAGQFGKYLPKSELNEFAGELKFQRQDHLAGLFIKRNKTPAPTQELKRSVYQLHADLLTWLQGISGGEPLSDAGFTAVQPRCLQLWCGI